MTSDAAGLRVVFATDGSGPARHANGVLRQSDLAGDLEAHRVIGRAAVVPLRRPARPGLPPQGNTGRAPNRRGRERGGGAGGSDGAGPRPRHRGRRGCPLGNPIEEILRTARRAPADLVVLGAKGHSGLSIMLLGSVSQGVVQHSTLPVLLVRPDAGRVSKVLIGYDDSPEARKAIAFLEPAAVAAGCRDSFSAMSIRPSRRLSEEAGAARWLQRRRRRNEATIARKRRSAEWRAG